MMREPTEPQASIKATGVGIPRLQAWEEVKRAISGFMSESDYDSLTPYEAENVAKAKFDSSVI